MAGKQGLDFARNRKDRKSMLQDRMYMKLPNLHGLLLCEIGSNTLVHECVLFLSILFESFFCFVLLLARYLLPIRYNRIMDWIVSTGCVCVDIQRLSMKT